MTAAWWFCPTMFFLQWSSDSNHWSSLGMLVYPDPTLPLPRCWKDYPKHENHTDHGMTLERPLKLKLSGDKNWLVLSWVVLLRNITVVWNLGKLRDNLFLSLSCAAWCNINYETSVAVLGKTSVSTDPACLWNKCLRAVNSSSWN